jgi:hypothetical protein
MLPSKNIQSIIGATLFGPDDVKLGRVTQVYVDANDGHPTWAEVHVGTLARHSTFVPLHDATWENDDVYVPYDKDTVKNAPRMETSGGLNPAQEEELGRHYAGEPPLSEGGGVDRDRDGRDDRDESTRDHDAPGHDVHRDGDPRHDGDVDRDGVRDRDEARPVAVAAPVVGTDAIGTERKPGDHGRDEEAPAQQLDENGVLWEERVVVSKERVPVAKVHLETTTVTENQQVTTDVQKERVVVEEQRTAEGRPVDGPNDGRNDRRPE